MFMFWYYLGLRFAYIKSPHPGLSPRAPLKHPQHSQWTGEELVRGVMLLMLRLLRHSTVLPQLSLPPPLDNEIPSVTQLEWLHAPLTQPEFPDPALNLIANAMKINGAMTISEFLARHSGSSANLLGKQLKVSHLQDLSNCLLGSHHCGYAKDGFGLAH